MDFDSWEPVYEAVLADFGFDRDADERARDSLVGMVRARDGDALRPDAIDFSGDSVAIAGAAPCLENERSVVRDADAVVAASDAARRLLAEGLDVDCMVTDLDKTPETAIRLTTYDTPVAIHAHGDNLVEVQEYVPQCRLSAVLPTTQAEPAGPVVNTGGFTDGDRAAFLADHCGAESLRFAGWNFEDPSVTETKRRKLRWAERLLYWLERRREERFPVLDGRRDAIDRAALPVE